MTVARNLLTLSLVLALAVPTALDAKPRRSARPAAARPPAAAPVAAPAAAAPAAAAAAADAAAVATDSAEAPEVPEGPKMTDEEARAALNKDQYEACPPPARSQCGKSADL